ncbi:MAG: glutathione S-transferase [Proteobacteria bacterium]|nr:glutathione S-transferase [Pseudomonadota bacterium]
MKLYNWDPAPNPRRALIFINEKGIDIPIEQVGTPDMALSSEYLAQTSHGLVPLLELDDGTQIGEAMAICRYLEEVFPDPPLMGIDAVDKGIVEMWERKADMEGMHAASEVFRNAHPKFADRGLPGQCQDPIPQIPELVERGKARVQRFFNKIDQQLADNPFLAGPCFTVADITAFCTIDFCKWSEINIPDDCKNVSRWYDEVASRPSTNTSK